MTEVAQILAAAGPAHHQAYIETNGADPEWPLWYADFIAEDLNRELGTSLTRSEIVYHLVDLERSRESGVAWPEYYAAQLLARRDAGTL